jgi:AcrR family transcriptional regulator
MTRKSSSAPPVDRRVRRTQATLQRALIDLVGEQDLSQITVADRADVSRSTFYDHHQDVHELAEAACTSMLDDLFGFALALDTAPGHPSGTPEDPDPALRAFFTHFADHAGLYRSLLGPSGSARVIEHVRRRTTAAAHFSGRLAPTEGTPPPDTVGSPGFPLDVPAAFVAGALLGVAADWLQRGCPRTPLQMTILTKPLLVALRPGTGTPPTSQGSG